jgi:hypothetical protein
MFKHILITLKKSQKQQHTPKLILSVVGWVKERSDEPNIIWAYAKTFCKTSYDRAHLWVIGSPRAASLECLWAVLQVGVCLALTEKVVLNCQFFK